MSGPVRAGDGPRLAPLEVAGRLGRLRTHGLRGRPRNISHQGVEPPCRRAQHRKARPPRPDQACALGVPRAQPQIGKAVHSHLLRPGHLQADLGYLAPGPTDPDGKTAPGT